MANDMFGAGQKMAVTADLERNLGDRDVEVVEVRRMSPLARVLACVSLPLMTGAIVVALLDAWPAPTPTDIGLVLLAMVLDLVAVVFFTRPQKVLQSNLPQDGSWKTHEDESS
jgi:hypothetical protein